MSVSSHQPDPSRFEVAKATLWFDRFMGAVIRCGGIGVILAVCGILYFIAKEVAPLFRGAEVSPAGSVEAAVRPAVLGVDEWGGMPFFYDGASQVVFTDLSDGSRRVVEVPGLAGLKVTSHAHDPIHQRVSLGLEDGRVGSFVVDYRQSFDADGKSRVEPEIKVEPWFQLEFGNGPVTALSDGDSGGSRIIVARRGEGAAATVGVLRLAVKRSLMGKGKLAPLGQNPLVASPEFAEPLLVRASANGAAVLVACADGSNHYFLADGGSVTRRQTFTSFGGKPPARIDFLFGGVSVVLTSRDGRQEQWSLFRRSEKDERLFGKTKEFPSLASGSAVFAASQRNRSFVTGAGGVLSIRHSTSGKVRWEGRVDIDPVAAVIDAKGHHFIVADAAGRARRFEIRDPHPEAGWRAFFGKVWYEGGAGPVYQWQSTGGTDDFEPKFSMVPLVFGSLKGTACALIFSVPVALLAAVFSAAFLPPAVKRVVKPAMEIMSSLPSVVLGFLAGLWLAPLLETKVPSVLAAVVIVPLAAVAFGILWGRLPIALRNRFAGSEWCIVLPVLATASWVGWSLGPLIESWWFVCKDPATGREIADFRRWWPEATGTAFEQRNSLVLGFMMGFAVIPVIFTIAEDALSNVPKTLGAAASALGASRWQVVWTILLPVASSGIFSALMIGFGRAVGETMIMVMATGNTPVTEWNLFNGMRTLSANIAVELPEAPVGSTHYRALFLGAVVLFALTFVMNTIAELLRQRLRDRNKIV